MEHCVGSLVLCGIPVQTNCSFLQIKEYVHSDLFIKIKIFIVHKKDESLWTQSMWSADIDNVLLTMSLHLKIQFKFQQVVLFL